MFSFLTDATLFPEMVRLSESALKASLILVLACTIVAMFKRRDSSLKHKVYAIAFAGIIAMPVMTSVLPSWNVIPWAGEGNRISKLGQLLTADNSQSVAVGSEELGLQEELSEGSGRISPLDLVQKTESNPLIEAVSSTSKGLLDLPISTLIFLVWALGAAGIIVHMLSGFMGVRVLSMRASVITAGEWLDVSEEVGDRLFLTREVKMLKSASVKTPLTWGGLKPVVMLPAESDSWPLSKKISVLTHEYAHIKRWDTAFYTVSRLACGLYWFNPLVWYAAKKQREEREYACDQVVIAAGTSPSDYAEHLIEIARTFNSGEKHPFGVLSMAKPSQLEGRVLSVLAEESSTGPKKPNSAYLSLGGLVAALILTATVSMQHKELAVENTQQATFQASTAQKQPADSDSDMASENERLTSVANASPGMFVIGADTLDRRKELENALMTALEDDPNSRVRTKAAVILGNLGVERSRDILSDALMSDNSEKVRMAAARSLSMLQDDEAYRDLLNALKKENDSEVRDYLFDLMSGDGADDRFAEIRTSDYDDSAREYSKRRNQNRRDNTRDRDQLSDRDEYEDQIKIEINDSEFADFVMSLSELGLSVADQTLDEVSRSLAEIDWDEIAEEISESTAEAFNEIDWKEIAEELSEDLNSSFEEVSEELERALIDEYAELVREYPNSRRGRTAREALESMDTSGSRRALRRLDRNQ